MSEVKKKRTLQAIDLNGSPLDQFGGNEWEVWEDENGKVHLTFDKEKDINAEKIGQLDQIIEGGGGSTVVVNPELEGDEEEVEGLEVDGVKYKVPEGTAVEANPELSGDEDDLTSLEINGTKYKVSESGSGFPEGGEEGQVLRMAEKLPVSPLVATDTIYFDTTKTWEDMTEILRAYRTVYGENNIYFYKTEHSYLKLFVRLQSYTYYPDVKITYAENGQAETVLFQSGYSEWRESNYWNPNFNGILDVSGWGDMNPVSDNNKVQISSLK